MIRYGYRPTIDAELAEAERRLIRLQQMEADARVVLRRWDIKRRNAEQDVFGNEREDSRAAMKAREAYMRVLQVSRAVDEQKTKVRLIKEGRLDHA